MWRQAANFLNNNKFRSYAADIQVNYHNHFFSGAQVNINRVNKAEVDIICFSGLK
jgi:hypothetical protein